MDSSSRGQLIDDLTAYQSPFEAESEFKQSMLELLAYPNCFERSLLHAHFTASVWVVDGSFSFALLTHHAKLNRWLQLGGHADGMEDLRAVAQKELEEESGLSEARLFNKGIFDIDIHTIPERKTVPAHEHYDVRFLFVGDMVEPIEKNHESKEVAWKSFDSIPELCNHNDSILRMISKSETIRRKI